MPISPATTGPTVIGATDRVAAARHAAISIDKAPAPEAAPADQTHRGEAVRAMTAVRVRAEVADRANAGISPPSNGKRRCLCHKSD